MVDVPSGLSPGTIIGSYEVVGSIGEGGMGEVYRARDHKLERDVAIKIIPLAFSAEPDRLARFEREARMLAALNHPHIGAIYGVEEFAGGQALVLEFVEGETLAHMLGKERRRGGGLPLHDVILIAKQIATALEAAHDRGIVHRDLKPANIKIAPGGQVKVLDFGLAKAADAVRVDGAADVSLAGDGLSAGLILGTAAYMSPEQARGQATDKRTDIWAFGCVVYELLTGRRAFAGETTSDTIASVLTGEPDWTALPAATPPGVMQLLQRCLTKDPFHRLRDIGDARIALETSEHAARADAAWRALTVVARAPRDRSRSDGCRRRRNGALGRASFAFDDPGATAGRPFLSDAAAGYSIPPHGRHHISGALSRRNTTGVDCAHASALDGHLAAANCGPRRQAPAGYRRRVVDVLVAGRARDRVLQRGSIETDQRRRRGRDHDLPRPGGTVQRYVEQ